jgi:hypothetical protein
MPVDKQKIINDLEKILGELKTEDMGVYSPVEQAKDIILAYRRKNRIDRDSFSKTAGISSGCLKGIENGRKGVRLENFQKALNAIGRKLYVK